MSTPQLFDQYHAMLDEFARGNPEEAKMIYSHREDVTLANPFGAAVVGWKAVSEALDFASSKFKDGQLTGAKTIAKYESAELITLFEIENWKAKVGDRDTVSSFDLRASSTFRFENGAWKLVHRHANPINSFSSEGPLRTY